MSSYYRATEDPTGAYFSQGDFRRFKDDPDKSSLDPMAWGPPRSPEMSDYSQFNAAQVSKMHSDVSTSFPSTQYSSQYLSPVSPAQASFGGPVHSPQIGSDLCDPMTPWMPSPTPEYDMMGQHSYTQQDSTGMDNFFVNPCHINNNNGSHIDPIFGSDGSTMNLVKREPDTFSTELAYGGSFTQMQSPSYAASNFGDSLMISHPSLVRPSLAPEMEIDQGVPVMTPPEEDDHDNTPQPRQNGRTNIRRKRAQPHAKDASKSAHKRPKAARALAGASRSVACKTCDESFKDNGLLHDHVQQAHARPLVCVFGYAGCPATFGSKNEWKRHVLSQHIILFYWLCTDADCVRANPRTGGTVFNRKDLYTQHVRRMHVPEIYKDAVSRKEHQPDWDRALRCMQDNAERKRCELPTYMECPAPGCPAEFRGASAWDDRMEHVARHLDGASSPNEPHVAFGGDNDETLTDWAMSSEVNIVRRVGSGDRWELVVPLKTTAKETGSTRKLGGSFRSSYGDEDGEGELE